MITPEQLTLVADAVRADAAIASLRARFPDLHFTECSEDDVSPRYRAALETDSHALYYISGATGHCLEVTNDAALATGILVAAKADEA